MNIDIKNKKILKLNNGIKLLLLPINDTKLVNISVTILLGNNHETIKTYGLTHYIEHLLARFTSLKYKNHSIIAKKLYDLGANSNAYVDNYKTNFYIEGLYKDIECFFDILSNTFKNYHIDKNIMLQEKSAVRNEITNYINNNYYQFYIEINKFLYKKNYKIFDWNEDIKVLKKINIKKIYKFINEKILYNNMIISVTFNKKKLNKTKKLIKKYFDFNVKQKKINIKYPILYNKFNKLNIKFIKNSNKNIKNNVSINYFAFSDIKFNSIKHLKLIYLKFLLFDFNGPIMKILRTKLGFIYNINLNLNIDLYNSKYSSYSISTSCLEKDFIKLINALIEIINNLSIKDLNNHKSGYYKYLIRYYKINKRDMTNFSEYYENYLLFNKPIKERSELLKYFKNFTKKDLLEELNLFKNNLINRGVIFYYSKKNYNKLLKKSNLFFFKSKFRN